MGCHSPSSGVPVLAAKVIVSPVASQCVCVCVYVCVCVGGVGVGGGGGWGGGVQLSFSSGIPVWGCFNYVFPVVFQCTLQVFAGSPSGIPVHTGATSGIPVAFQCTLTQRRGYYSKYTRYEISLLHIVLIFKLNKSFWGEGLPYEFYNPSFASRNFWGCYDNF